MRLYNLPFHAWILTLSISGLVLYPALSQTQPGNRRVPLTLEEDNWLNNQPEARMMVVREWRPADFIDEEGNHQGIGADVLRLISERTGFRYKVVPIDLPERLELNPDKRGADGVVLSAQTKNRSEFYQTTRPYLRLPSYFVTRRSVTGNINSQTLQNCRVSVVSGYAIEEYFRTNHPRIILDVVPDTKTGMEKVSFGLVDAFACDIPVTTFYLEQEGYSNLKIAGDTGFVYDLGILIRKDWPLALSILQKGLDSISESEMETIRARWIRLPYEPFYRSDRFWNLLFWVFSGIALTFCSLLAWTRMLRYQVRLKTAELSRSEELYRSTLENLTDAVLLTRYDGTIVFVSPNVEWVFGIHPDEFLRLPNIFALFPEAFQRQVELAVGACVRNLEYGLTTGGNKRIINASVSPLNLGNADLLMIFRDVTERNRLQEQMHHKQRLESIGLLAGGISHDFNNILQAIQGFSNLAKDTRLSENDRQVYLQEVEYATQKATRLTQQLLSFAKSRPAEMKVFDLNLIINEMDSLLRGAVGNEKHLIIQPFREALPVRVDRSQIEQIFLNLITNSRDAIPKGGSILVTLTSQEFNSNYCEIHRWARPGRFALIRVQDDGSGISDDVLNHIFEPFFTTKGVGGGTGLGLAVVYGSVQSHGGIIRVQSQTGKGTTFFVYLPLQDRLTPVAATVNDFKNITQTETDSPRKRDIRILAVDDDRSLLLLTKRMLEGEGRTITIESSPVDAFQLFQDQSASFDILILDITMPEMNGRELAEKINLIRPDLPIIWISGFEAVEAFSGKEQPGGHSFLRKPFTRDQLIETVEKALKRAIR